VSILEVDTWQTVNIWTENVIEVSNEFLPLIQIPLIKQIKQIKIQVLNLKKSLKLKYQWSIYF
jgi:hypothetical protein